MTICSLCNENVNAGECFEIGTMSLCQSCHDDEVIRCNNCDEELLRDENAGDDDIHLCQSCYERYYTHCDECDCLLHNDSVYYLEDSDDDSSYCSTCYYEKSPNEDIIHQYNYKPSPIFYGGEGDIYMGVELETDNGGLIESNASDLLFFANKYEETIYIKRDGSLDNGFELVTHPCNLDYHMNNLPWHDVLKCAKNLQYKSHQTSTCGLHIHVGRKELGYDYDDQENTISRILFFVEKHWDEMLKFSRRTEYQMNRWSARYGFKNHPKEVLESAKKSDNGRYTAVNLCNQHTIEFRLFRGSLRYQTLIATMQLVEEICKTAKLFTDEAMQSLSWQDFVKEKCKQYPELITYLKLRDLYVNEPICEEEDD